MSVDKYIEKFENTGDILSLISELKNKNTRVISRTVNALIKIGEPVIDPLITALKDEDKNIRFVASKALAKIGSNAVPQLIAELGNSQSKVRVCAVETLGKIGNKRAIEPLINTLKDEKEDVIVREYAVYALEKIGEPAAKFLITALRELKDSEAITPLTAALHYNKQEVREVANEVVLNFSYSYQGYRNVKSIIQRDTDGIPSTPEKAEGILWSKIGNEYRRYRQKRITDFF
ncbi:MAG: HEAT repeat domain-containing protein [Candidatus Heimdallarchaeota archaeon]|nr:HEAT repeat domain-containing protein [Candidatus Heimdallarchaeota archaeon]MCK4610617.1 HEAT repeat domain-containing protein [Candidatus Heimdallarchaeota archaeon]